MFALMGASIRQISAELNKGMMVFARGMASAPAARLGPFAFFSVLFGAVLGWLFWDELLGWRILAGTLLVLVSAMLVGRGMSRPSAAALEAG